ncbi:unnamed protein product [Candidula unifasciata]|uniref:Uncharacterized protein n=1 Tax=Candidula unifasciata TaxID=100452 RepID=A0A8S3ZN20_9EUPU|nr:unnamed protein product [Candidula unifasciata]
MGNRQGHNKEASKPKEEKKNEKDVQKGKKKEKAEKRKKQLGNAVLDPEIDFDESSHVTGGDSESCVFHSAENISFSPYLDSSTRSEHEQGASWLGVNEQASLGAQHPYVLSSKDFQDGFSLEACIPSEIARLEDVTSSTKSRQGQRTLNPNSSTASKLPAELATSFTGSHSSASGEHGDSFPATYSPLVGTTDRSKVSASPTSTPVQKCIRTESQEKRPLSPTSGQHHPHFYNHNRIFQHPSPLPVLKPTSPKPQRRTLSPKISSPFKVTTSESSSPAPSTPGPQRRAANFLALFRSSSKRGKAETNNDEDSKTDSASEETRGRSYSTSNESDRKVKSKPAWKTWERPRSKKSKKPIKDSIFGTSRKNDKQADKLCTEDRAETTSKEETAEASVATNEVVFPLITDSSVCEKETQQKSRFVTLATQKHSQISTVSSNLETKSNKEKVGYVESGHLIRERSPPLSSTAAVCIMKLEELERSIEKTIREKFPDAEPFLIKERSKEELHGSRSLPATPSNKKKLHLVRDEGKQSVNTKLYNRDVTRFYNETYESPSPSTSPIVLRRFGARTRHASISPKMQRAKTAALFNSPSEMSSFGASRTVQSTSQVLVCHRLSAQQEGPPEMPRLFSAAQKSVSKYDNVMVDEEAPTPLFNQDNCSPHDDEQLKDNNRDQVNKTLVDHNNKNGREQPEVMIPTLSAVFGSVSPKLRRHLQVKFDEINDNIEGDKAQTEENVQLQGCCNKKETSHEDLKGRHRTEREVTKASLSSFPVCSDSSDKRSGLIKPKEHELRKRSSQSADKSEEKADEQQKTAQPPREIYTASEIIGTASLLADRTEGINNSLSEMRATRDNPAEASCKDNTKSRVSSSPQSAGKPSNETEKEKLISFGQKQAVACAVSSQTTQPGEIRGTKITAKSGQLGSSATKLPHSTNRVLLFDSSVSSPNRSTPIYPPSPATLGHESTCSEKNAGIAQAQDTPLDQRHGCKLASTRNTVDNSQGTIPLSQPSSSSLLSSEGDGHLSDCVTFSRKAHGDLSKEELTADISLRGDFVSKSRPQDAQTLLIRDSERDRVTVDTREESNDSESDLSSLASQKSVGICYGSETSVDRVENQRVSLQLKRDVGQANKVTQDEERVSVFKQPLSEVISQMISRSKLQPQQHERHLRQQQQHKQHRQRPGITLPDQIVVQSQLVTVQKHEQLSEVLQRRGLQGPAGPTAADVNDNLCQLRCQEIQTDSFTTADKSVDSRGLIDIAENFGMSKTVQTQNPIVTPVKSDQETTKDEQTSGCSEKKFVKMASNGRKTNEIELLDESNTTEHVPPPSPTALQQLIEESGEEDDYVEEEDDEEGEGVQAMATMSREQQEIKEFSDTIFKRLSELLGSSNQEDDDGAEEIHQSNNDEPEDSASDKDDFPTRDTYLEDTEGSNIDISTMTENSASIQTGFPVSPLVKILTVDTSSSLTTTTSSESDVDDAPLMFHSFQNDENNDENVFKNTDDYAQRNEEDIDHSFLDFEELQPVKPHEPDHKPNSREYHSDDDVAKGRGIPDYYDDKPLWSRRQKPPGQLSAAMMAIRWRERRERWLKKRRRNRTDLMSTGSSDTGSEYSLNRHSEPTDDNYFDNNDHDVDNTKRTNDMGSGILTSPKYSKPILPFFDNQARSVEPEISSQAHSSVHRRKRHESRSSRSGGSVKQGSNSAQNNDRDRKCIDTQDKNTDKENGNEIYAHTSAGVKSVIEAPSIEDTFQELMSVQTILKEMQECKGSVDDNTGKPDLLPLTTENVRSIREYYKDFYSSGNGRRSRMSATDRTESDLDLYSEIQDDASSESELYADDEGDDDGQEPYATAEDDPGATGRGSGRNNKRDEGRLDKEEEDDSDTSLVLSCTFYNSKTHQQNVIDTTELGPTAIYPFETKTAHRPTPVPQPLTTHTNLNSDDEFWSGSAAIDESYRQLETAADAVSSTFQNAREQMHDIQYHLQALRRQMEVMQSDITNVSLSLSQSTSTEYFKK